MDIKNILQRCLTGDMSALMPSAGQYIDTSDLGDFQANMDKLVNTRNFFEGLPAEIRAKFDNDLRTFVEVASNPENADELRELGMLPPLEKSPAGDSPADKTPDPKDQDSSAQPTAVPKAAA